MLLVPAMHSLENGIFLWSRSNVSSPAAVLHGHKAAVVEAQWRKIDTGWSVCVCACVLVEAQRQKVESCRPLCVHVTCMLHTYVQAIYNFEHETL